MGGIVARLLGKPGLRPGFAALRSALVYPNPVQEWHFYRDPSDAGGDTVGGIMSTRWSGHARRRTVEEMGRALFVSNLRELLAVGTGTARRTAHVTSATARVTWAGGFSLAFTLRDDAPFGPRLEIGNNAGVVCLERTAQPFGGSRWWLLCTGCGIRRSVLYLSAGPQQHPRCRECLGLAYRSQRLAPLPRIAQRAAKIRVRAGGTGGHWWPGATDPARPRKMHLTTYARHRAALDWARAEYNAVWLHAVARFLNRIPK